MEGPWKKLSADIHPGLLHLAIPNSDAIRQPWRSRLMPVTTSARCKNFSDIRTFWQRWSTPTSSTNRDWRCAVPSTPQKTRLGSLDLTPAFAKTRKPPAIWRWRGGSFRPYRFRMWMHPPPHPFQPNERAQNKPINSHCQSALSG